MSLPTFLDSNAVARCLPSAGRYYLFVAWDGPGNNNAGTALLSERLRQIALPVCALSLLGMGVRCARKIASVARANLFVLRALGG